MIIKNIIFNCKLLCVNVINLYYFVYFYFKLSNVINRNSIAIIYGI